MGQSQTSTAWIGQSEQLSNLYCKLLIHDNSNHKIMIFLNIKLLNFPKLHLATQADFYQIGSL